MGRTVPGSTLDPGEPPGSPDFEWKVGLADLERNDLIGKESRGDGSSFFSRFVGWLWPSFLILPRGRFGFVSLNVRRSKSIDYPSFLSCLITDLGSFRQNVLAIGAPAPSRPSFLILPRDLFGFVSWNCRGDSLGDRVMTRFPYFTQRSVWVRFVELQGYESGGAGGRRRVSRERPKAPAGEGWRSLDLLPAYPKVATRGMTTNGTNPFPRRPSSQLEKAAHPDESQADPLCAR